MTKKDQRPVLFTDHITVQVLRTTTLVFPLHTQFNKRTFQRTAQVLIDTR